MWEPFLISFAASVVLGFILIPLLKRLRFRQTVRQDGPKSHLYKTGITTMGGFIFIIPIVAGSLVFTSDLKRMGAIMIAVFAFALIGFTDDLLKILRKSNDGLSVMQKTFLLLLFSAAYSVYFVLFTKSGGEMFLPFSGMTNSIEIPAYAYIPFLIIFLYSVTNSVNLTDGVDGLAGSVTGIIMLFFFVVAKNGPDIFPESRLIALCAVGALLGFLLFNAHPARVFMGDTGSMALGGLVGVLAIEMKIPWILLIAGFVYVAESLSSIIQVAHYKRTKRRIFKMAPIHHHFEMSGWGEQKVVLVFGLATVAACTAAYWILGLF
ncbi:MAG: phospho-N-acetylmuramoyl-pentapeptide-transferase [Clostridia bacterium]|nr:phospho-N-acetylmuramoyl-pentapeptide-transferase [Clostridia bacterium]